MHAIDGYLDNLPSQGRTLEIRYTDRSKFPIPVRVRPERLYGNGYPDASIEYEKGKPVILLREALLTDNWPSWADFAVLHETAHHLLWHYHYRDGVPKERWEQELEADAFAQAVLVGWGRRRELPFVYSNLRKLPGSADTHPPGSHRVIALMNRLRSPQDKKVPNVKIGTELLLVPARGRPPVCMVKISSYNLNAHEVTLRVGGAAEVMRRSKWTAMDVSSEVVSLKPYQRKVTMLRIIWPRESGFRLRYSGSGQY